MDSTGRMNPVLWANMYKNEDLPAFFQDLKSAYIANPTTPTTNAKVLLMKAAIWFELKTEVFEIVEAGCFARVWIRMCEDCPGKSVGRKTWCATSEKTSS